MKKLYLFDFDGTLSMQDSSKLFYKTISNPIQYLICYYVIPIIPLIKYFIFRGDNFNVKKTRFNAFIRFCSSAKITNYIEHSDLYIDSILKKSALNLIRNISKANDVYIVSASLSILLEKWTKREGVYLISNIIKKDNSIFKGYYFHNLFDCDGIGKVLYIKKHIDLNLYDQIIAYGDTQNDFYMFEISDRFYYKTIN